MTRGKILLAIAINFISSKDDNDEERVMHSKSDKNEADEVIGKLFKSTLKRYRSNSETWMKSSEFFFDYIHLLYYKCHKRNPNCGGSYVDSLDCI